MSPRFTFVLPFAPCAPTIRTAGQTLFRSGGLSPATLRCSCKSIKDVTDSLVTPPNIVPTLPPGAKALSRSNTNSAVLPGQAKSIEKQLSSLRFGYEDPESPLNDDTSPKHSFPEVAIAGLSGLNGASLGPAAVGRNCDNCPIRYLCQRGHIVTAHRDSPACRGCPLCQFEQTTPACNKSRAKLTLFALSEIARERNGTCLASLYESSRTPVPWRCQNGHTWLASADNVKGKRSWCPECARARRKLSIADMRAMAAARGGKCLSAQYVSGLKKLRWQCADGHEFLLAPNNIRREPTSTRKPSWCPFCKFKSAETAESQTESWQNDIFNMPNGEMISKGGLRRSRAPVADQFCPANLIAI
jgi:hypothetical protein